MGESAEELKIKMQTAESIVNEASAVNHVSGTQNGFANMQNHVGSAGDHKPNSDSNHVASPHKHKDQSSSSSSKPKDSSSTSSLKRKDHHSSSSSSKHRDDHKTSSSSSSKHKEGHSSSSSKSKDGSSSSSKPKDGSSSSPSKSSSSPSKLSSSEKHKDSPHSKDKHHSSSEKKHSSLEHKLHSSKSSSSSDKHKDGSSKTSSSDKPKEGIAKSSSSSDKHKEGGSKSSSSSGDKHRDGSNSKSSSSSDKHRDSSSKHSSEKHKDGSSKSSSSSDKHKDGSSKSSSSERHKDGSSKSSSSDKHKDSSSKHSSEKHKDKSLLSSSSSSDKHKDGSSKSSSSSDKHKDGSSKTSSSDKHRDGSSKSSSSDKHKDGLSKSSEKHKDESKSLDKHKEHSKDSSSSDKHKEKTKVESSSKSHDKHGSHKETVKTESSKPVVENDEGSVNEMSKMDTDDDMQPYVKVEKIEEEETARARVKKEPSSDEDEVPLSARIKKEAPPLKRRYEESSDDEPLSSRIEKVKKVKKEVKQEDEDFKPSKKRKIEEDDELEAEVQKKKKKNKLKNKSVKVETKQTIKAKKKAEEEQQVWKWWEEEKRDDGVKWTFLEHKGPVFAPLYERLPKNVKFYYDGKEMLLNEAAEEVGGFYAKMLDHDYATRDVFNNNFFKDWRKVMSKEEREIITDLKKCNFKEMHTFYLKQSEDRKNRTKEQKQELKKQNEEVTKEYGFCTIDGHTEKIGNFRIEPPGLFRGRGDHPKQGRLKKRVEAEEVIINCSKKSKIPVPPEGHKWKEVRHDNSVTWLASWTENIQGATKYVMLNAASKLKGEKDWQKYEIARKLHKCVDKIRATYREDWKSKEMRVRQRAVALYFIDKLALRAGNEKEEGETADTVGCCSLRVEHIKLYPEKDGKECVVEFDFLGKDSIRYTNSVPVEKRVFKNLQLFVENKQPEDDLFDRLNTALMNKHLHELMEGLTAKVFRTYNASRTLQEQLDLLTNEEDAIPAKLLSYNRANRAVAILCNHQRSAPKTFAQSMENLINKVEDKRKQVKDAKKDIKDAKSDYKNHNTERNRAIVEKKKNSLKRLEEQLTKLEVQATDKEENKEIALGTSKLNYLDPRISVAWCKKWEVPLEKVYNKTQRDKFRWAIDMATEEFKF